MDNIFISGGKSGESMLFLQDVPWMSLYILWLSVRVATYSILSLFVEKKIELKNTGFLICVCWNLWLPLVLGSLRFMKLSMLISTVLLFILCKNARRKFFLRCSRFTHLSCWSILSLQPVVLLSKQFPVAYRAARCCTFSRAALSFSRCGSHTTAEYSRIGRIMVVYEAAFTVLM